MVRAVRSLLCLLLLPLTALGSWQTPVVSSCFGADGSTYPVRFSAVRVSNAIYGQDMTMTFTITSDDELGDQPTATIDVLKPSAYDRSCQKNFGSCEYPMCDLSGNRESNDLMDSMDTECPIHPGVYTVTITATVPSAVDLRKRFKTCRGDEEGDEAVCLAKATEHNAEKLRKLQQLRGNSWFLENREYLFTTPHMSSKNSVLPVLLTLQNGGQPVGCNVFYMTISE
ncbi:uncharacterized protein [Dermacentor albipictus]|uniref:uncharacterized protein isoform X1 n=1 Tax=Dermacentor albipictus TaxID=60249 RepID=UPI0031FDBE61